MYRHHSVFTSSTLGRLAARFSIAILVLTVVALLPLSAHAANIDVGDSLNPGLSVGETFQIAFVTSGKTQMSQSSAVLTPAQIADAFVQNYADNASGTLLAGLGTWKAIASFDGYTSHASGVADAVQEHAKDRALVQGPVYRVDGLHVANDFADFWDGTHTVHGTITVYPGTPNEEVVENGAGISVTESGGVNAQTWTWSGSYNDGTLKVGGMFGDCPGGDNGSTFGCGVGPQDDRTTIGFNTRWGSSTNAWSYPGDWINAQSPISLNGDNNLPFYGLSEVIIIVPEPASVGLMLLGLAGMLFNRRK